MKNSQNELKTATIINGVVLTEEAITFLELLQESDNGQLKEACGEINDAISQLILYTDYANGSLKDEVYQTIKYLNVFNRSLKDLMKP